MDKNLSFVVPANAKRCLILVPHGTPTQLDEERTHPLTKESVNLVKQSKSGCQSLIAELTPYFGAPVIVCGQDPASIMTAVLGSKHGEIKTTIILDSGSSQKQNRIKARNLLYSHTKTMPMAIAYGHPNVLNKAFGSKNAAKIGIKAGIEAAVIFINGKTIVSAHRKTLLVAR